MHCCMLIVECCQWRWLTFSFAACGLFVEPAAWRQPSCASHAMSCKLVDSIEQHHDHGFGANFSRHEAMHHA